MIDQPLRKNDIKTLDQITHCLKRNSMYIGSINEEQIDQYVYIDNKLELKIVPTIPGMIKILDEIISNSLDEFLRTTGKYATKIRLDYNKDTGEVRIEDNGRGLPIEYDKDTKKWTPEEIFTSLRSGSNFNDDDPEKGNVIGCFGVGSSLTCIYSKKFTVETANGLKYYKQTFENHLAIKRKPIIEDSKENYTIVTYTPNYDYFNVSDEAKENLGLLYEKRIRDLAFCYPEISFYFMKQKIAVPNLKNFVKSIHEISECNEVTDGRIALFYSDTEFQQMSFCNGANTYNGGSHVDYASNKIVEHIKAFLKKRHKLPDVKNIDIKSRLFLILSIRMSNPQFEGQVKSELKSKNGFKALIDDLLSEKFLNSILKNDEIILPIVETYKLKLQVKDNIELKKLGQTKKKVRVEKYYPASMKQKYIFLVEGDSALGLVMPVIGRSFSSFFPLKGKPLNALEVSLSKITSNDELRNIIQILNLRTDKDIQDDLTHEKICLAVDADSDGKSICALLLCFFHRFAPSLLKNKKISYFQTPIIVAKKKDKIVKYFITLKEYKDFENKTTEHYVYEYKKGLGSWKKEDLKFIIDKEGLDKFIIDFEADEEYIESMKNWMSDSTVNKRKENLINCIFDINGV